MVSDVDANLGMVREVGDSRGTDGGGGGGGGVWQGWKSYYMLMVQGFQEWILSI